jgi:hypothetical protein
MFARRDGSREPELHLGSVLAFYRRCFWYLRSWFGENQIAIGGTSPEAIRLAEEVERQEERRERWLRRFRLLPRP